MIWYAIPFPVCKATKVVIHWLHRMLAYPNLRQPKGKGYCGPTSAAIALNALGFDTTIDEMASAMRTDRHPMIGTYPADAVAALVRFGVNVQWYTNFSRYKVCADLDDYNRRRFYSQVRRRYPWVDTRALIHVDVSPMIATMWDMALALRQKKVVLTSVCAELLWKKRTRKRSAHLVVIKKISFAKKKVWIQDPAKGEIVVGFSDFCNTYANGTGNTLILSRRK